MWDIKAEVETDERTRRPATTDAPPRLSATARVVQSLRLRLSQESWSAGDRLPSEPALAKELGVSRVSVRAALAQLESEGLVDRRHGSGTYVNSVRPLVRSLHLNVGSDELIRPADTFPASRKCRGSRKPPPKRSPNASPSSSPRETVRHTVVHLHIPLDALRCRGQIRRRGSRTRTRRRRTSLSLRRRRRRAMPADQTNRLRPRRTPRLALRRVPPRQRLRLPTRSTRTGHPAPPRIGPIDSHNEATGHPAGHSHNLRESRSCGPPRS